MKRVQFRIPTNNAVQIQKVLLRTCLVSKENIRHSTMIELVKSHEFVKATLPLACDQHQL